MMAGVERYRFSWCSLFSVVNHGSQQIAGFLNSTTLLWYNVFLQPFELNSESQNNSDLLKFHHAVAPLFDNTDFIHCRVFSLFRV